MDGKERLAIRKRLLDEHDEPKAISQGNLYDIILGGQDGLVNVLALVLGMAAATNETRIVLISGLAGTFAESISMAAVGYTSSKAAKEYYDAELKRQTDDIDFIPDHEKKDLREIYYSKGFRGRLLNRIVNHITSDKKLFLKTMMTEEIQLSPENYRNPLKNLLVIGFATVIGSLIPLVPFFFAPVRQGVWYTLALCGVILFSVGALKAKVTLGNWKRGGLELMIIGLGAAVAGYGVGIILGSI